MLVPWTDERCIICALERHERRLRCNNTAELSREHLIPEAIGGKLVCNFVCKHCNDHLGEVEAYLKTDASIRCAIENLRPPCLIYGSQCPKVSLTLHRTSTGRCWR